MDFTDRKFYSRRDVSVALLIAAAVSVLAMIGGGVYYLVRGDATPPSIVIDKKNHSVSLTTIATGCDASVDLEFLIVGPDSDRDYEAMFVAEAKVSEIAAAFENAGIPVGTDYESGKCRLWPVGNHISMRPTFSTMVREVRGEAVPPVIFTGGKREADNIPVAETNEPCAVFALYNCPQSLLQLNDSLEQSDVYGRFKPAAKLPRGSKQTITFIWSGKTDFRHIELTVEKGRRAEALNRLKGEAAQGKELDVLLSFAPDMTVREATEFAAALAVVDSPKVKINGFREGELFYRAYLPLEQWRDRQERLMQPPEVRFDKDGAVVVTEILADWTSSDAPDPILSEKVHRCESFAAAGELVSRLAERTSSALVFATPETPLATLYALRRATSDAVVNWYVFTEE